MGSDPRDSAQPSSNERPCHLVEVNAFSIGRNPITNREYAAFIASSGYPHPGHWPSDAPAPGTEDMPVTYVSWHDAMAFCAWAGVRLPTEAEWEKAASGSEDSRWWPWGNALPDATRAHFGGSGSGVAPSQQGVMRVGQFPAGASPYGVHDMAGNVAEWTHSRYQPYPYRDDNGREDGPDQSRRVIRGGSFVHGAAQIRCAARTAMESGTRDVYIGFRVAAAVGKRPLVQLDLVEIPPGPFWMGSDHRKPDHPVLADEVPRHLQEVDSFRIAQFPTTNAQYLRFVEEAGYEVPSHWRNGVIPLGYEEHPVTHVDWNDAQRYCDWAGVRLPTEVEWEYVAAGTGRPQSARLYPWGNQTPSTRRLNFRGEQTTIVGSFPAGASPEGVLDLAGNVWEWVSSLHAPYPYDAGDGREDQGAMGRRVLRGGSFLSPSPGFVRSAMRSLSFPTRRREHIGFRVVESGG